MIRRAKPKVHRIPISQARTNLRQIARRAHDEKAYFVLEDRGEPVAGIMGIDELEDYLEIHDPKMQEQIRQGRQEYLEGKTRPIEEFLAEIEAEIEAEARSARRRRTA
jgi:PHD/YefM family antitoxin component YafN of YafNO toxin-antitoxin module